MSELRRAALRLHGLGAADRAWMLARLEPDERSRIEPVLAELAALAPARTREWTEALGPPDPPDDAAGVAGAAAAWRCAVDAADARAIAAACDGQPDCVVATLLVAGDWSWRERFLKSLPKARSREICRRMRARGSELPPALRDALLEATGRRLGESGPGMRRVAGSDAAPAADPARAARAPFWWRISSWGR